MQHKRRSGRIAKELPIVLLGTDTAGKVFSEPTKTVVLSRHGAGVLSRYLFAPDEVLTLRLPDSTKEAEIRLVGQIGGEPGRYVYGVAFVDPEPDFWQMEFPPPEALEPESVWLTLECSVCRAQEEVEQHEIEEDVYSVNGSILRYCEQCGTSTHWKKASGKPAPPVAAKRSEPFRSPLEQVHRAATPIPAANQQNVPLHSHAPSFAPSSGPEHSVPADAVLSVPTSYSGESAIPQFASLAEIQSSPAVARTTAVLAEPETAASLRAAEAATPEPAAHEAPVRLLAANGRRVNRRKHMRIRVNFSACVRHREHGEEIVECENVSKGGLCFHSRRRYSVNSMLEVAAPFSPGEPSLFVPAQIKRVEQLSGDQVFRYGVEYAKTSSGKSSF